MDVSRPEPILECTGERMSPELSDGWTFWEHIYRYRFAAGLVKAKRVLDIACGEGYGTHALSRAGARSVVGIDVSEPVCEYARKKYGIDARCGDAEEIPLSDRSVDVVVSFETIEHVARPARFLDECARVLDSGGMLVISTPNTRVYGADFQNPFHCSEMEEEEFSGMLRARFLDVRLFSQVPKTVGWWSLRSLAAEHSPWRKMRGYWRLTSLFRHSGDEVEARFRKVPIDAILSNEVGVSNLVNPFAVRRRSIWSGEQPKYIIAVARKS